MHMRTMASPLAPLFRSETQQEVLAALFLEPGAVFNINELAAKVGVSYASVHREVIRLLDAGLLVEQRVGHARLVRPNEQSPAFAPLRELLVVSFGAAALLAAALGDVRGVDAVALFGSFAARQRGVPGPVPQDVDVLVVGTPDPLEVYAAVRSVSQTVGRSVNPIIMNWEEWREPTAFTDDVRAHPLIPVSGDTDALLVLP